VSKETGAASAEKIWGTDADTGNTWQYLYFFTKPQPVGRPLSDFRDELYAGKYFGGFTEIAEEKLEVIQNRHGSVQQFMQSTFKVVPGDTKTRKHEEQAIWWVNQGQSYAKERAGGYLWAPLQTESGQTWYHWTNMERVKAGEVILHYADGIRAISRASSEAVRSPRPAELPEGRWEKDGNKVEAEYSELAEAIRLADVPMEIRLLENGPFDRTGAVKQGYLFELPQRAADALRSRFAGRWPEGSPWGGTKLESALKRLADQLFVTEEWLKEIVQLLEHKRQVIFYGPPGTGKTYIAKKLAEHLAGSSDRIRLASISTDPLWPNAYRPEPPPAPGIV